jgi:calcineurin-like phosphoesterase
MTGPHDSIIGTECGPALARFLTGMPSRFEPATGNPRLHGVVISVDEATGKATSITRLDCTPSDLERLGGEADAEP